MRNESLTVIPAQPGFDAITPLIDDDEITAECPKNIAHNMNDPCGKCLFAEVKLVGCPRPYQGQASPVAKTGLSLEFECRSTTPLSNHTSHAPRERNRCRPVAPARATLGCCLEATGSAVGSKGSRPADPLYAVSSEQSAIPRDGIAQ
jgi:hypothetical protein